MSELITQRPGLSDFRWKLLATVSALTLLTLTVSEAKGEDSDRPTVWIELGGQLSRLENGQEAYVPPFAALTPSNLTPPQNAERPARYGFDESAALTIQPQGSDWAFSASIRYGRAGSRKSVRHQTHPAPYSEFVRYENTFQSAYYQSTFAGSGSYPVYPIAARFTNAIVKRSETHTILDFQAGKDLGIGLFGRTASSTLNVGIRVAQFTSKLRVALNEDPDFQFKTNLVVFDRQQGYHHFHNTEQKVYEPYHSFAGEFSADRSFTGLGPSISWNSSEPVIGNSEHGELTFDWGMNAALLFGRQKAKTHHQTTGRYHTPGTQFKQNMTASLITTYQHSAPPHTRSRGMVVPNVGGFAGLSVKYPNAKVSFGYKADFFFGAMDGGIDVRHAEDVGFYGPFATISIGLP